MARNPIPTTISHLIAAAGGAADGAHALEADIGLQQNTEACIRADRAALIAAASHYDTRKAARAHLAGVRGKQGEQTRRLLAQIAETLRLCLGCEWGPAWQAAGWTNPTLALPRTQEERLGLLARLEAFFNANPAYEVPEMAATAAACAAQQSAFAAASAAADQAENEAAAAREVREAAVELLEHRMRSLLEELSLLLADEDPRWHAFGFHAPADPEIPEIPEPATVKPGVAGSQTLMVGWPHALRAERYRVFVRVPGQSEPLLVQNAEGEQATVHLNGLAASGAPIEVALSAANEAGESRLSDALLAMVP